MLLGYRLMLATTFFRRLRGLLFTSCSDAILLISPCKAIHTIGMKYPLDVAFIDQAGIVVRSERKVGARSILKDRKALAVLERQASSDPWPGAGEQLSIAWFIDLTH